MTHGNLRPHLHPSSSQCSNHLLNVWVASSRAVIVAGGSVDKRSLWYNPACSSHSVIGTAPKDPWPELRGWAQAEEGCWTSTGRSLLTNAFFPHCRSWLQRQEASYQHLPHSFQLWFRWWVIKARIQEEFLGNRWSISPVLFSFKSALNQSSQVFQIFAGLCLISSFFCVDSRRTLSDLAKGA